MVARNKYAHAGLPGLFDSTPKEVWAAIAVSLIEQINPGTVDDPAWLTSLLYAEWQFLHDNGIVPQRPRP